MIDVAELRETMDRDGVVCLRGFLSAEQLADATAAYEWTRDHRGPGFTTMGGDERSWQDLSNPASYAAYAGMLSRSPIPPLLQALWGGPVWYMYEQIFHKEATDNFTPWHQDTPYMPVAGQHHAVFWISLDPVSREATLEYCRGSHRGPVFNGTSFKPGDPTDPFYKTGDLPRLPDIEADRSRWDITGWATEPGDVVLFHPSVLHGGGAPGPQGRRRTLTLRFFGEDAIYCTRPGRTAAPNVAGLHDGLRHGDPFRHPVFPQLA
ncbi:phytanoyl-CoA dioxygenase family protein [Novosphingobium sp. G106]|uniref:phytanoyl-CoA dioxygenase family protein n=1 Tax=Novosphingobium sp. G106 TaxID=2849500 RepID=UPI001C2D17C0|nr:phytanoyl-CoA dioxygenase family protein [Novosphingobium sp. G106]MBV1687329.1 phytanoyl-CoA dioxygenase family protein [Novosphingobium sp. G106]